MSSSWMLSDVRPPITEWMPHELLPIMPPNVAYWCVDVSGANVRFICGSVIDVSWSWITPGSTIA